MFTRLALAAALLGAPLSPALAGFNDTGDAVSARPGSGLQSEIAKAYIFGEVIRNTRKVRSVLPGEAKVECSAASPKIKLGRARNTEITIVASHVYAICR